MSDLGKGICPKCGAHEIYESPDFANYSAQYGAMIPITGGLLPRFAHMAIYVCGHCGYTEKYISSEKDLETIRRKWRRVNNPNQMKKKNDEG
jgi:ribosomal protein S27AE